MEDFVPIPGYDGYFANRIGEVKGIRGRVLKPWLAGVKHKQYKYVGIGIGEEKKKMKVCRLIGLTFIPNPDNKPVIDHINGNQLDDRAENLRWATVSENGHNRGATKKSKSGIKGLCWIERDKLWKASFCLQGVHQSKQFKQKEDALEWLTVVRAG